MTSPRHVSLGLVVFGLVAAVSCGGGRLSLDEAGRVVAAQPGMARLKGARVDAVSQASGSNEAIVRVAVADSLVNAKFRRYDNGWRWEFVETTNGSWISASRAMNDIYERDRLKRAKFWADERAPAYKETIDAIYTHTQGLGVTYDGELNVAGWEKLRILSVEALRSIPPTPERLRNIGWFSQPVDGWGHGVTVELNAPSRQARFVSSGPDAAFGTPDDVVYMVIGKQEFDRWRYTKEWWVPEGLDAVIERKDRRVTYVKVVQ